MGYEVAQRIAERIADHEILKPDEPWVCNFCGTRGKGMGDFAHHVAAEIVSDLGISQQLQWVPTQLDGRELLPVATMADAEYAMRSNSRVLRVDREWRLMSRWFRPARDG